MRGGGRNRAVAGLRQWIGDADQRQLIAGARVAGQRRRDEVARTVKANEREVAGFVLGDAIGMAEAWHRDGLALIGDAPQRDEITPAAHHDCASVFDAPAPSRQRTGSGIRKSLKRIGHRDRDRRHGAFRGLIVKDRDAAHLAAARLRPHHKFFQPLLAGNDKGIGAERAEADAPLRRLLLLLEQGRQRRFTQAESLDLDLTLRRGPAAAGAPGAGPRYELLR